MRIVWEPPGCISLAETLENCRQSRALNLDEARGSGRLALVGGGLSVARNVDALRAWPGEVWGINGAASWLCERGIDATLVTLHPMIHGVSPKVRRAVLGEECSPELFAAMSDRELRILTDDGPANGHPLIRGGNTCLAVTIAAPHRGFDGVTYFGCEGSYGGSSHAYDVYQDPNEPWVVVRVAGETFRTKLELLHQSAILAELVHAMPDRFEDRSGGLLSALVRDHEYDVIEMAPLLVSGFDAESCALWESMRNGASTIGHSPQSAA